MADDVLQSPDGTPLYRCTQRATTPESDSEPKEVHVESLVIKLLTPLDPGSANDGSRTAEQNGFVFGKKYEFAVVRKDTQAPIKEADFHWQVVYQSPEFSQNKLITKTLKQHGYKITFELDDLDMCGCELTITAYDTTPECGSDLKVFAHNRFRWFDGDIVKKQIAGRMGENWRINQGRSCLCGMAAVYYAMLLKDKDRYQKLATELHRTGHYVANGNDLQPAHSMYDVNPKVNTIYQKMDMPEIDWIVLAGTRSSLSSELFGLTHGYNGLEQTPGSDFGGINWPGVMGDAIKQFSGYNLVTNSGLNSIIAIGLDAVLSPSADAKSTLMDIDKKYKSGSQVLMMICADMLDGNESAVGDRTTRLHWVVYAGDLEISEDILTPKVKFKVYTWAIDPETGSRYLHQAETKLDDGFDLIAPVNGISNKEFSSNYFGHLEIK